MLKKSTLEAIAKASGLKADELANAIKSEDEVSLEIGKVKTFTEQEWQTYEEQVDKEMKAKYDDGKSTGENQAIRDLKLEVGLEYEGKKRKDFIEKFKAKVLQDADKNPDEKIVELQKDIKTLREVELPEKDNKIKELSSQLKTTNIVNKIGQYLPSKLPEGLTKKDAETIIQSNLSFDFDEDGNEVVKKDGEILKDKTRKNLSFKDAISDFTAERKWITNDGGRGENDKPGGARVDNYKKARTMSELNEIFEEKGINSMSSEARNMMLEASKDAKEAGEEFAFDK